MTEITIELSDRTLIRLHRILDLSCPGGGDAPADFMPRLIEIAIGHSLQILEEAVLRDKLFTHAAPGEDE